MFVFHKSDVALGDAPRHLGSHHRAERSALGSRLARVAGPREAAVGLQPQRRRDALEQLRRQLEQGQLAL